MSGMISLLRGSVPGGGTANGLPGGGYQYRDTPGWWPEKGVHRNPAEVLPAVGPLPDIAARGAAAKRAAYEARLAALEELDADGVRIEEITRLLGVSPRTVGDYRAELRRRAAGGGGGS